jgi:flagellar biosynthesis repressor protein FlbT
MQLHLKKGEKLYLNGAVIKAEQRCTIELLNNVTFLLESHIMQPERATSPLRQLYFVVQTMLIEPSNAGLTKELYWHQSACLLATLSNGALKDGIVGADVCVRDGRYFEALRAIRKLMPLEDDVLLGDKHQEVA